VSHEISSACGRLRIALMAGSTLWKTTFPTVSEPVQGSSVYGVISPAASAASATIGLNVEPVGYSPCVALLSSE
jgi:hypothetical protein